MRIVVQQRAMRAGIGQVPQQSQFFVSAAEVLRVVQPLVRLGSAKKLFPLNCQLDPESLFLEDLAAAWHPRYRQYYRLFGGTQA